MSQERTYTLDADMCDAWLTALGSAHATVHTPMLDAIRAQQPKPRIPWVPGTKVRRLTCPPTYMLTDDARHGLAVIVDSPDRRGIGTIHYLGYVTEAGLDPEQWEAIR